MRGESWAATAATIPRRGYASGQRRAAPGKSSYRLIASTARSIQYRALVILQGAHRLKRLVRVRNGRPWRLCSPDSRV